MIQRRPWTWLVSAAFILCAVAAPAEEPAKPDVNKVIEQMAAVGPDALLARVKELKAAEEDLKKQAAQLRQQADQKEKEAAAMRARIEAVEKFTNELAATVNPEPAKAEPAKKPEEKAPEPEPEPEQTAENQM